LKQQRPWFYFITAVSQALHLHLRLPLGPQQYCPIGYGQCCSPAGKTLPKGAICKPSTDPCLQASTCNGASITCPTQQKVSDGTPCSLAPAGLFKAASDSLGRLAAAADISDVEAMKNGYKKCYRSLDGQCLEKGKRTAQAAAAAQEVSTAEYTPAEPWFYCSQVQGRPVGALLGYSVGKH
jgi:hypothetical protein